MASNTGAARPLTPTTAAPSTWLMPAARMASSSASKALSSAARPPSARSAARTTGRDRWAANRRLREVESMHAAVVTGIIPLGTAVVGALWLRQRP